MKILKRALLGFLGLFAVLIVVLNIIGAAGMGTITPDPTASRDGTANKVVMVFGATGSAGDGLLKAAMEDSEVETIKLVKSVLESYGFPVKADWGKDYGEI